MMDRNETLQVFCTKSKPNCNACPMKAECKHFASALSRFTSANFTCGFCLYCIVYQVLKQRHQKSAMYSDRMDDYDDAM